MKGGTGDVKTTCNYGGCLFAERKAAEMGYTQVMWLDAIERKYVEEVGTMNVFIVIDDNIVTPPLNGSILAGVTRDSVLKLAPSLGYKVIEKNISIDEIIGSVNDSSLKEVFGSGTAAVISPIKELLYKGTSYSTYNGTRENVSKRLFDEITALQYGEKEDSLGWTEIV